MSIGSIASTIWAQTTRSPATIDTAWGSSSSASPVASASTQRGSTAGQTGSADPFQQLAADIQALLVQAQGGTGVTATTAIDPQSIMNHLQGTQTASTEQTGATGHANGHHHHHENTDTDASAATEASAATGSSGATVSLPTLTA